MKAHIQVDPLISLLEQPTYYGLQSTGEHARHDQGDDE